MRTLGIHVFFFVRITTSMITTSTAIRIGRYFFRFIGDPGFFGAVVFFEVPGLS